MTIQTLTSNSPVGDGLPDIAGLTKLANAFFTALPGQSVPDEAASVQLSDAPVTLAPQAEPVQAAPSLPIGGLHDFSRAGGSSYSVPSAYAAGVPQLSTVKPSAPTAGGAPHHRVTIF